MQIMNYKKIENTSSSEVPCKLKPNLFVPWPQVPYIYWGLPGVIRIYIFNILVNFRAAAEIGGGCVVVGY